MASAAPKGPAPVFYRICSSTDAIPAPCSTWASATRWRGAKRSMRSWRAAACVISPCFRPSLPEAAALPSQVLTSDPVQSRPPAQHLDHDERQHRLVALVLHLVAK